ncbi:hypothetical protein MKX08_003289 [Trichoderma sp. CBMAI-0020]|nr:hypothetical protein MKX08_003289 [Trichoderma sp. CBMAI-0020]
MDHFGRQASASIFIVYAHDSDVAGNAGAQCVRNLIKWLLVIQSRLLSSKSPLRWPREGGIADAQNILSNQLCLLPRGGTASDMEEEITSVDKVILCGSNALKKYYEHAFTDLYVDSIVTCYKEAQSRNMQPKDIRDKIRTIVESHCNSDGFHPVLTELAFLKLRHLASLGDNGNIIPVALGGDGMKYLSFLDDCDPFLKLDSSQGLALQHKLFFNLLRLLYADSHAQIVIDEIYQCYTTTNERLRSEGTLTQKMSKSIAYTEIFKAQDVVLKVFKTAVRDEEWILTQWQQRIESALSQRDEIINWLPQFYDVTDTHQDNLQQRQGQTGTWILEDEKYQRWKESEPTSPSESAEKLEANRLWCYGKPGAGKTIISSIRIEDIEKSIVDTSVAMAYVFCKHRERQTASSLVLSLVAQLAHQHYRLSPNVTTVAAKYRNRKPPAAPNLIECEKMLDDEVRQFKKVFFVVDALDERLDKDYAYQLLSILQKTKANVLITSRDVELIGYFLAGADSISIVAKPDDVRAYLNFRCEESAIVEEIVSKADGTFLLPRMHMNLLIAAIEDYPTAHTLKAALHQLPSELKKTYDEYMQRILQSDSVKFASDVLSWVLFARQHVGIKVIQEAISLQHCGRIDYLIDHHDLLGYCISFIMEKGSSGETGHHTEDKHAELEPLISEYMSESDKVSSAMQRSMQYLGSVLRADIFKFDQARFEDLCQHPIPSTCSEYHAAAFFGIREHFWVVKQREIDCTDSNGWTPIWWAILGGQDAMVKLLLEKGAKAKGTSNKNIPLVIWMLGVQDGLTRSITVNDMTVKGRAEMGNVYLWPAGTISCFDAMQNFGPRTLRIATKESAFEVIRTLASDELNVRGADGNSVLMTAARLWQYDVVRQLIDQGADTSLRNNFGETAFSQALTAWRVYSEVRNLRVSGQVRIGHSIFISPETTLDPYSFGRRETMVEKMLVDLIPQDLDVNSDDSSRVHVGACVSLKAFSGTDEKMYTLKMGSIIKVMTHGNAGESNALPTDFETIVRMLLDKGADIDAEICGKTALAFAAENEYLTVFRRLLAAGADITRVDPCVLERLRRTLGQDEGSEGMYGKACMGTLQDFQTHDYCVLLLHFMIPQSFVNWDETAHKDNSRVHPEDMSDLNAQLRLSSGDNAEEPYNVPQRKWTAQKEYDGRVREKSDREPAELLAMIASVLGKANAKRRVCRRDEFWAFGGWGREFSDDVPPEAWRQHLPWLAELVYRGSTGTTTHEVPNILIKIPGFRWKLMGQAVIEPYRVGLSKRSECWIFPRASMWNKQRFGHLLLKSFLIQRNSEKVWVDGMADF